YINPGLYSLKEVDSILKHEKIHSKAWHSTDLLIAEVNLVFYWFNPGAWLMKYAIKENLEFLTDRKIVNSGMDRKTYQYHLLKISGASSAPKFVANFNSSNLKRRIAMMNKKRSSGYDLIRYLLFLPTAVLVLFLVSPSY